MSTGLVAPGRRPPARGDQAGDDAAVDRPAVAANTRHDTWQGTSRLLRCDRAAQNPRNVDVVNPAPNQIGAKALM